jgi:hypothetical protein
VRVARSHRLATTVLIGLLGGLLPLAAAPAMAVPADEKLPSANPVDWTPRVLNNAVLAVTEIGSKVVVGGSFTTIQQANTSTQLSRPYLFAYNADTGAIDNSFVPVLNGRVESVLPHPDGDKVWVAGAFSRLNGVTVSRVVLLNLSNGQRVTSFTAPSISAVVNDIGLAGNRLYIGGAFTTVGGQPRSAIASLDATTGALTSHLTTGVSGVNSGGSTSVSELDVTSAGDKLVAVGNFSNVQGEPRSQIAIWDTGGTTATLSSWRTDLFGNFCNAVFYTYMRDVDLAPDGSFFVVVTTGSYRAGRLCDTASRWETQATGPGQSPTWVDYSGGDTFTSVEVTGPVAYVGGHQRWLNNPFAGDREGSGAVPREGIAALDTRNGLPFSWNPGRERGVGVWDFWAGAAHVWGGSDTNSWGGEYRPRLAGFPFADGKQLPPDQVGSLPGDVLLIGNPANSDNSLRQVPFDGSTAGAVTASNGPEGWSQARGAFQVDNQLFTGWSNGTFTVREYVDGVFGPSQPIELYAYTNTSSTPGYLNNFIRDVASITGMVYEPKDSRIYYTMSGSSSLFYRYFTPESRIVGAQRFTVPNTSALSPSNVRGMFLDGTQLYFSDQNGVLKRVGFDRGVITGTATAVNSAIDWRARGMTILTSAGEPPPNQDPTAEFTSQCFGLSCQFDASGSSDPDGSVQGYQWEFGDGTQGSGKTTNHSFDTAGTYQVTLTVTDNRSGTDSVTYPVTVEPQVTNLAFRDATSIGGPASARPTVQVPASVQPGDTMLLFVSNGSSRVAQPPAGWTFLDQRQDVELRTDVFWRTAEPGDAGTTVQVALLNGTGDVQSAPNTVTLAAYSGAGSPSGIAYQAGIETSGSVTTNHRTPDVNVPLAGSLVLSYWADRTSNTTSTNVTSAWQPPAGEALRADAYNTASGGRVTSLLTDSGAAVDAGTRSGLTAVANGQTTKATLWSIVLPPGA